MKELKDLKELTEKIRTLYTGYEDVAILLEMGYEEEDPSVVKEIEQEWKNFVSRHCCQVNMIPAMRS